MRTVRFTYREPQPLNSSPGSPGVGGLRRIFFFFLVHKRDVVRSTEKSRRTRTSALWKGGSEGWTDASLGGYHMEPTHLTHSSGHRLMVGVMALTRGSVRLLECPWFSWPIK